MMAPGGRHPWARTSRRLARLPGLAGRTGRGGVAVPSPYDGARRSTPMGEDVAPAGEAAVAAVLTVTPAARGVVLDARSQEAEAERFALWAGGTGARAG